LEHLALEHLAEHLVEHLVEHVSEHLVEHMAEHLAGSRHRVFALALALVPYLSHRLS